MRLGPSLAALVATLAPRIAFATWSVVAVDPDTREVGVGAATCTVAVELVQGLVPDVGVLAAQADTNLYARNAATRELRDGATLDEAFAVAESKSGRFGLSSWDQQQFAIATLGPEPNAAAHTGSGTVPWSGSASGPGVSVQGNTLRGREVVDSALAAFRADEGEPDLAERIMRALEAGAAAGGDHRCPIERPALSAFLSVARPGDDPEAPSLSLVAPRPFGLTGAIWHVLSPYVPEPGEPSPVDALREMLDARRYGEGRSWRPGAHR